MTEYKTKQERIQELINKVHELRKKKLFTIEYLEQEMNKLTKIELELDKKLAEIMGLVEKDEIKGAKAIILTRIIDIRKTVLDGYKSALKECRLTLTFLIKEEGKYQYELAKVQAETS